MMLQPVVNVFRFPGHLVKNRELLWSFVHRELKARYEGSLLGLLWPVIQPMALFAVYYLIFAKLLRIPVTVDLKPWGDLAAGGNDAGGGWRGTFFLISGILPWVATAESLTRCTGIVLENANLIKKIAFPSEFLPLYAVILHHIYFVIGSILFVLLVWAVNGTLPMLLLWFPLLLLLQMFFTAGLGMLFGALNIFIRDVSQVVPLLMMFWMFISPVFYSPEVLILVGSPEQKKLVSTLVPYLAINPMYNLLTLYREIFMYGRRSILLDDGSVQVLFDQGISVSMLGVFAVQAFITFLIGFLYFQTAKGRFADEV